MGMGKRLSKMFKEGDPWDLFCSNFGSMRGPWAVCRSAWCPKCYVADPDLKFHMALPKNDEGSQWKKKTDARTQGG